MPVWWGPVLLVNVPLYLPIREFGINQFSNMSWYTFPLPLSSAKKNGTNTRLLEMAQNTFTLGLSRSISIRAWGFWDPHVRVLCLLTFPYKKKVASSLKMTRSDQPWSVSILLSESSQNASRLDGSSGWSFCTSCSLYGYNCGRFRRFSSLWAPVSSTLDWLSAQISWGCEWKFHALCRPSLR